jgi:hypothetical protein
MTFIAPAIAPSSTLGASDGIVVGQTLQSLGHRGDRVHDAAQEESDQA